jgi:D-tyrosyl-tRNA(Tyr) deacylase
MGLVVLVGIGVDDCEKDIDYLLNKILNLRIFADSNGKLNLSIRDVGGELLIISQFTLFADTNKGRRPSFIAAASPEMAESLFNEFVLRANKSGIQVATGIFQAHMKIELINDGPVTIMVESR